MFEHRRKRKLILDYYYYFLNIFCFVNHLNVKIQVLFRFKVLQSNFSQDFAKKIRIQIKFRNFVIRLK